MDRVDALQPELRIRGDHEIFLASRSASGYLSDDGVSWECPEDDVPLQKAVDRLFDLWRNKKVHAMEMIHYFGFFRNPKRKHGARGSRKNPVGTYKARRGKVVTQKLKTVDIWFDSEMKPCSDYNPGGKVRETGQLSLALRTLPVNICSVLRKEFSNFTYFFVQNFVVRFLK